MTDKFPVTTETPTVPNPGHSPEDVLFLNLGTMVFQGRLTAEEANKFLDDLGASPNNRFWGCATTVNPKTGRFSTHFFNWVNGDWENGTEQRQKMLRENIG